MGYFGWVPRVLVTSLVPFSELGSGSRRAPSPMEKALTRREHNFIREQTDDYDHEHDADNLVHSI